MTLSVWQHFFPSARALLLTCVTIYSIFFGKHVEQPRRDIFEKAAGLSVSHSTSSGFLTQAESETGMAFARQHDLIGTHIDAVRPDTSSAVAEAVAGSIVKVPGK